MSTSKHGLSIGIERSDSHIFLSLKAVGNLTHTDYELITPMLESALSQVKQPEVDVLFDGTALDGWELRAAWDDLKLGLKHNNKFRKIAIYGNKNWLKMSAKVGAWFISGEIKYFENVTDAINWLREE
jgi:hypothetical protein